MSPARLKLFRISLHALVGRGYVFAKDCEDARDRWLHGLEADYDSYDNEDVTIGSIIQEKESDFDEETLEGFRNRQKDTTRVSKLMKRWPHK